MDTELSYKLFSNSLSQNLNKIFFLHGNGFPPKAYCDFLNKLSFSGNVFAMYQKPLSPTEIDPLSIRGWNIFKDDALHFLKKNDLRKSVGVGHSMGAIIILVIEIQNPGTFKKIFLLDPVITSPFKSILYKMLLKLGLIDKFHPMILRTNNKKMIYETKEEIYKSYRSKKVFSKIADENLKHYINSIIQEKDGQVEIKISKKWENTIYRNGSLYDYMIWKNISKVKTPVYIITPKNNEFGHFNYGSYLKRKNNKFINLKVNNSTHLFPLERPEKTAELIISNINF